MTGTRYVFRPHARPMVPVRGSADVFPVRRIYCVGQNYRAHAQEMGASGREPPFFFAKPADAVCLEPLLPFPPRTGELHHEVELVVALGRGGTDVAAADALALVFGYGVGVDLTRRDLQSAARQVGRPWTTAKGFDRSAPLSPLRAVEDCGHPTAAQISLAVNGEVRQRGNTRDMSWAVPEILAELSTYFELHPGDLVFTGTPPGVGPLQPGDRVQCEIEGVGQLGFRMGEP